MAEFLPPAAALAAEAAEQVALEVQFEGYIGKQKRQVERARRLEDRHIPADLDYEAVLGLRSEARERLLHHRPGTVGQAGRIAGVNPADVSVLLIYLERYRRGDRSPEGR